MSKLLKTLQNKNLAFLGAGQMASAMLSPLLKEGLVNPSNVIATRATKREVEELREKFPQIHATTDNREAVATGDYIVVGIKPINLYNVLPPLKGHVKKDSVVMSIMAGIPIQQFEDILDHHAICRIMPNTPVKVQSGICAWNATPQVTAEQKNGIRELLSVLGEELEVPEEKYIDMATAISGSSPAYFFTFLEALSDAGVHIGLPRYMSEKLAIQAMLGSVLYAQEAIKHQHISQLRNEVTSPGGSTAAALYQAEKGGIRSLVSDIVWAAYRRTLELAKSEGKDKVYGPGVWEPKDISEE